MKGRISIGVRNNSSTLHRLYYVLLTVCTVMLTGLALPQKVIPPCRYILTPLGGDSFPGGHESSGQIGRQQIANLSVI